MSSSSPPNQSSGELSFGTGLIHWAPEEKLYVSKYYLLWIVSELLKKPKGPRLEHVLIPATLFVGILLALLPADFQDSFGLKAEVWEAFTLFLTIGSGVATFFFFVWWIYRKLKDPERTALDIVDSIIDRMEQDRKRQGIT